MRSAALAITCLIGACGPDGATRSGRESADATGLTPADGIPPNPFAGLSAGAVTVEAARADDLEAQWALAHCGCVPTAAARLLAHRASGGGVLPQILAPDIREEVRRDESLKQLATLPPLLSQVATWLLEIDQKIESEVRIKTASRLARALPGGTRLAARLNFRFDLFARATKTTESQQKTLPRAFNAREQAAHWALVAAVPNLWEQSEPLAYGDHGLQLLATAVMLSEWKYVFGLADAPGGPRFGGLIVPFADGDAAGPRALDPRDESGVAAFLSGDYQVSYPPASGLIELATNTRESWQRQGHGVPLDEQAMILAAAARAFERLRPEARAGVPSLFGATGIFPDNAHELPLAFLAVVGPLLEKAFVDADGRRVWSRAYADDSGARPVASLIDLARFAGALALWVDALENLDGITMDETRRQELATAHGSLKRASQLVVQIILRDHVAAVPDGDDASRSVHASLPTPLGLVNGKGEPVSRQEAAEVLATLAAVATNTFDSPFLRQRLASLGLWFADAHLADVEAAPVAFADAAWTLTALQRLAESLGDSSPLPWLEDARRYVAEALAASEGGGA